MLVGVLGLTLGPLLATAGYGLYLRSSRYADGIASQVSAFLGAPVQIGSAIPLDLTSQCFRDVVVWLPGEFYPIFYCDQAIVRIKSDQTLELELRDGQILAETDTWNQATIAALLRTAFSHDFRQVRMASVKLIGMDIFLRRGQVALSAGGASGRIDLSGQAGRIDILCDSLNGRKAAEPVGISCRFQATNPPLVEQLSLSVKHLPAEALLGGGKQADRASDGRGPDKQTRRGPQITGDARQAAATAPPSQPAAGWLSGTIIYRQKDRGSTAGQVEFTGDLEKVDLAIFANKPCRKSLAGKVSGTVAKAVFDAGRLGCAQGRLHVEDFQLTSLLAAAGYPKATGLMTLDVHELQYEDNQIKALLAAGQVRDFDVEPFLRNWSGGTITGRLSANLEKVKVIDGRLDEVTGQVQMTPPADAAGTIDRAVLDKAVQQLLNIELPPVLPDTIAYTDLGARLHGADNELYLEGIAGPDDKYLLVADFSPASMPLIVQPTGPLPLEPLQAMATTKLKALQAYLATWAREKVSAGGR